MKYNAVFSKEALASETKQAHSHNHCKASPCERRLYMKRKSYSALASETRSKCLKLVDAIIQKRITNRSLQEQINLQKTCLVRKKATYNEHRLAYKTLREMDMDYMWTTFYTEADIILAQDPLQVCLCPKTLSWMEPEKEYHLTARVRATDTPLSVTVDGVMEKKIILEDPYQTLTVPARPEVKINKEFDDFLFLTVKKNAEYGLEVIKAEPSNAKYRKFKNPLLSDFATSPVCEKSEFFKQRDKIKNKLYKQSIVRFDLRRYAEKLGICNPVAAGAWQGLQYCGENFENLDIVWTKVFQQAEEAYDAAVKQRPFPGWNGARMVSPSLTQMVIFGIWGVRFDHIDPHIRDRIMPFVNSLSLISGGDSEPNNNVIRAGTFTNGNTHYRELVTDELVKKYMEDFSDELGIKPDNVNHKTEPKNERRVREDFSKGHFENKYRTNYEEFWSLFGKLSCKDADTYEGIPNMGGNQYRLSEIFNFTPSYESDLKSTFYVHVLKDVDHRIKIIRELSTAEENLRIMNPNPHHTMWHDVIFCGKFSATDSLEYV